MDPILGRIPIVMQIDQVLKGGIIAFPIFTPLSLEPTRITRYAS